MCTSVQVIWPATIYKDPEPNQFIDWCISRGQKSMGKQGLNKYPTIRIV